MENVQLVFMGGSLVVGIGGLALSFATIRKNDWVRIEEQRKIDQVRADERMAKIEAALSEHKTQVAREYARNETLAMMRSEVIEALNRLTERVDMLIDRRPSKST
jgi:hypothetical protein